MSLSYTHVLADAVHHRTSCHSGVVIVMHPTHCSASITPPPPQSAPPVVRVRTSGAVSLPLFGRVTAVAVALTSSTPTIAARGSASACWRQARKQGTLKSRARLMRITPPLSHRTFAAAIASLGLCASKQAM